MVGTAAGLVIDLRITGAELENRAARSGGRIRGDADNTVCPRAQEEVPPLTAYVSHGQHRVAWQLLLDRRCVGQNLFRQSVPVPVGARLVSEVGIEDVVSSQHLRWINRKSNVARQGAARAVRVNRLYLVLSLARSIVVPAANSEHRLVLQIFGRP